MAIELNELTLITDFAPSTEGEKHIYMGEKAPGATKERRMKGNAGTVTIKAS
jgi:hypothetical protein